MKMERIYTEKMKNGDNFDGSRKHFCFQYVAVSQLVKQHEEKMDGQRDPAASFHLTTEGRCMTHVSHWERTPPGVTQWRNQP